MIYHVLAPSFSLKTVPLFPGPQSHWPCYSSFNKPDLLFSFQVFKLAVPSAQNALPSLCTAAFISRVGSLLATQFIFILHLNRQHTRVIKVEKPLITCR